MYVHKHVRMYGRTEGRTDGRTDGRTGHFVLPDLPEHTTTCGASGPKIKNLTPRFWLSTVLILHGPSWSQPCVVLFMYGIHNMYIFMWWVMMMVGGWWWYSWYKINISYVWICKYLYPVNDIGKSEQLFRFSVSTFAGVCKPAVHV